MWGTRLSNVKQRNFGADCGPPFHIACGTGVSYIKRGLLMSLNQSEKGQRLRSLHERKRAFIIPNPYDAGTARLLEQMGFEALATTSSGYAFTQGRRDGGLMREQALAGVRLIAEATDLPVSADLENGFGDAPETAAETIRLAAEAGAVGGSVEDSTGRSDSPIYELGQAV